MEITTPEYNNWKKTKIPNYKRYEDSPKKSDVLKI